jgi:hypothetical protein
VAKNFTFLDFRIHCSAIGSQEKQDCSLHGILSLAVRSALNRLKERGCGAVCAGVEAGEQGLLQLDQEIRIK